MKILVIGSGGREHALAWKLAQSERVTQVYVAPGNGGTALDEERLENLPITDLPTLCQWAQDNAIALTVVGPEAPLAAGVVDMFRAAGLRIFGPTQAAAQLESSKAFSKAFMQRHGIPTAAFDTFTDAAAAHAYVEQLGAPIVIKADGLAAGKGVVVATTLQEAHAAVADMLEANTFGVKHNGQARVVIEEFLQGEEASFMAVCNGQDVVALATSQDHKRLLTGDLGPNTGGMGAYSPAPVVTAEVHARAMREVILPTLKGMEKDGTPYTGFLYAGLMVDNQGQIKTLEFNCRMGDPETQPIMMRLKSDLFDLLWAATDTPANPNAKLLQDIDLQWDRRVALGVVVAAHGYPANPRTGEPITELPANSEEVKVFHAGTKLLDGTLQSSGGRVLCVTALAESAKQAQAQAYEAVNQVKLAGMQYRSDIGYRALIPTLNTTD
ncbi:MAG: phosphoribosylamine--glycine ligase [Brachymonas sp.]|jgi:phosphoribosylamine--glycine ligase|nr:phosphoribosylamine--glycine ligase [Brachymonas sp.]MBP7246663.1 phosphoribosylamine--glycine ligase [Brachymonas sp.]MBP8746868.1 phosphoribosylamine--glycine ligase [Brachymonas sp.]